MAPLPEIATPTLPNGPVNIFYRADLSVTGGTGSIVLSVPVGTLPPGLLIQQAGISSPMIYGTPTTPGTYKFTLWATDDLAATDDQEYEVLITGDGITFYAPEAPETFGSTPFEIFQLQCWGRDAEEAIHFAEYESDMGDDGYSTQILYGAQTGRRRFKISVPSLADFTTSATVVVNGVTYTPAAYLWDLFRRSKRTGRPFVITSGINNQYYLVKFSQAEMSYQRFLTKLFSSQLELVQVRVPGVSVFDPKRMPKTPWAWYGRGPLDVPRSQLYDNTGNGHPLALHGNVLGGGDEQNSWPTMRFNGGATNDGYANTTEDPTIYEAFFIVQINEANFSGYNGLLSGSGANDVALTGEPGTTKFYSHGLNEYEYRKNGILYERTDRQAPMQEFGLVHARWQSGVTLNNLQIGKYTNNALYMEMDFGEAVLFNQLNDLEDSLELGESMMDVWDI